MIAILLLARRIADLLVVRLDAPIAEICRAAGASRPSAYEQYERVLKTVASLADVGPGRPATPAESTPAQRETALQLTIDVLSYQLDHPGSVVPHTRRTSYSPAFRRFILTRFDDWEGTVATFAQASRLPIDTLADWIEDDRSKTIPEPEQKAMPSVPFDASRLVHLIAAEWQRWEGHTRPFLSHAARLFSLSPTQVRKVLTILGVISPRCRRPFRHRGETHQLSPGAMLVTDGKQVDVELTASGRRLHFNWQAMVDQSTACDTAAVVTHEECAPGVDAAFQRSTGTLGGVLPDALLHDNKPCYDDAHLRDSIEGAGTMMIRATPGQPENKAILEGAFGLFEQRVGTLSFDDSSTESLIRTAVEEALRAYTAATNSVPRIELGGHSRLHVLQTSCPSFEQQQRDRDFLVYLKAKHEPSRWQQPPDPTTLDLLNSVFERLNLLDKDPSGSLRSYLASYEPAAIRRAAALVSAKLQHGNLDLQWAHRYLVKVIQSQQDFLELEHAQHELLELTRLQNQSWTHNEEREHQALLAQLENPHDLARAIADHAAHGAIPVQAAFWSEKLLALLERSPHLLDTVINHLVRLYEAPHQSRLALIDLVLAQHQGVA